MSRHIIAAVTDLFFVSKLRATAEALGISLRTARHADALIAAARDQKPDLIVVDLESDRFEPLALGNNVRVDPGLKEVPLIGFYSHVHAELPELARNAGFTQVMPRSAFASKLPEILNGKF